VNAYPDVVDYKVMYAQALYKAGNYQDAQKVALSIEDPQYSARVNPTYKQ
jgi:hypothetical protein